MRRVSIPVVLAHAHKGEPRLQLIKHFAAHRAGRPVMGHLQNIYFLELASYQRFYHLRFGITCEKEGPIPFAIPINIRGCK